MQCSNLTDIEFPASLKSIGGWAFYACQNLTNIKYIMEESGVSVAKEKELIDYWW